MKRRLILRLLVLILVVQVALASSDRAEWVGLWKIAQKTDQGTADLFLFVPEGSEALLWGPAWNRMRLAQSRFDSGGLHISWIEKGFNTSLDGKLRDDAVRGTWSMVHPQYLVKNEFSAARVFSRPDWSPLGALGVGGEKVSLIDLNARILEQKSGKDFSDFWTQEFSPDFFVFLGKAPEVELVREIVESGRFGESSARIRKEVESIIEEMEAANAGYQWPAVLVLLPFGEGEISTIWVGDRRFILLDAMSLAQQRNTGLTRAQMAHRLLSIALENELLAAHGSVFDLFRAGVALYLTTTLESSKSIGSILGISNAELATLNTQLPQIKGKILRNEEISSQERRFVGYDFVRTIGADLPTTTLVRTPARKIAEDFQEYLSN